MRGWSLHLEAILRTQGKKAQQAILGCLTITVMLPEEWRRYLPSIRLGTQANLIIAGTTNTTIPIIATLDSNKW